MIVREPNITYPYMYAYIARTWRAQEQRAVERTGTEELERLRLSQSVDQSETRAAALYKEVHLCHSSTLLTY